jgi:excisionase family DNA binding protein
MNYITIPQLARVLNISRSTVFKWVNLGKIKATKVGGTWIIDDPELANILKGKITDKDKRKIEEFVQKAVEQYGELFKRLSKE